MNDFTNHGSNDGSIAEETVTVETKSLPGFFARVCEKLRENPIKTSVAMSLGLGGAAVAGHNYRRYGTVSPGYVVSPDETREVVAAAVQAIGVVGRMFR